MMPDLGFSHWGWQGGIISSSLLVTIGICLGAAWLHLLSAWRLRRSGIHLSFGIACLSVSAYIFSSLLLYRSATTAEYLQTYRYQISLSYLAFLTVFWYLEDYVDYRPRHLRTYVTAVMLFLGIINLALPPGAIFDQVRGLHHHQFSWGETIAMIRGERSVIMLYLEALMLPAYLYLIYAPYYIYRHGRRGDGAKVAVAFAIILVAAVQAALVDFEVIEGVYLLDYSFLALVALIRPDLSRDLVDKEKLSARLHHREAVLQAITDRAEDAIFCKDRERRYTLVNPAMEKVLGLPASEIIGKTPEQLYDPETTAIIAEVDNPSLAGRMVNEVRTITAGGERRTLHTIQGPLFDEEGEVSLIFGIVRDVTESRRAAEALAESERRLNEVADHVPGVIFQARFSGGEGFTLPYVSAGVEQLLETPAVRLRDSADLLEFIHPDDRKELFQGRPPPGDHPDQVSREFRVITPSGKRKWLKVGATRHLLPNGDTVFNGAALDVTREKVMEQELHKADRIESVGVLAGGIAHDFNNILTGILGNLSLARLEVSPADRSHRLIGEAETACLRASDLTRQLLTFSRGGEPVKKPVSLREIIGEASSFALRGAQVASAIELAPDLWAVEADPGQLHQVFNNIVINAKQAMEGGGRITVTAHNLAPEQATDYGLPPGPYVRVTVTDHGPGVAPENLAKIFDPYYTTKDKGSGLGLATAFSIVSRHGGTITVESTPGQGASFHVILPALGQPYEGEQRKPSAVTTDFTGKRVLVMDDEEIVRELACVMLTDLGCRVDEADSGDTAVARLQQAREKGLEYDLAILDLTVPGGVGGKQAIQQLRRLQPSLKALVSSGYSNDPIMGNFADYGFDGVLPKPYAIEDLIERLREIFQNEE